MCFRNYIFKFRNGFCVLSLCCRGGCRLSDGEQLCDWCADSARVMSALNMLERGATQRPTATPGDVSADRLVAPIAGLRSFSSEAYLKKIIRGNLV